MNDLQHVSSTQVAPAPNVSESDWLLVERAFRSLVSTSSNTPPQARAYLYEAAYHAISRDYLSTIVACQRARETYPECGEAYVGQGIMESLAFAESKSLPIAQSAVALMERAQALGSESAFMYFFFGRLLSHFGSPHRDAYLTRALELDPTLKEAAVELANFYMWDQKDYSKALASFEQALSIDPDYLEAYRKTNFYELYLRGPLPPEIQEHMDGEVPRMRARMRAHQLDKLPFRFISGITPFIGHYGYLDTYSKIKKLGWCGEIQPMLLAQDREIVNRPLLECWSSLIPTISDPSTLQHLKPLAQYLEFDFEVVPGFQNEYGGDTQRLAVAVQEEWERRKLPPLLSLSPEEVARGRDCLAQLGVPHGAWFVGLHVRDDGFKGPDQNHALRNADIATYYEACKRITERGGWVIRMGDPKMVPMASLPGVIDYAHSPLKSAWMDVFLWSQCRFFIGGNSGPSWIPHAFGVPCVRVNWTPITRSPWTSNDLMIPKRFVERDTKRPLSFTEMINPSGRVSWTHSYDAITQRGLIQIDNTSEELAEVVAEMMDRLDGMALYTSADERRHEELQRQTFSVSASHRQGDRTCRFGREFINRHEKLLG